jgi:hypothetical protein
MYMEIFRGKIVNVYWAFLYISAILYIKQLYAEMKYGRER